MTAAVAEGIASEADAQRVVGLLAERRTELARLAAALRALEDDLTDLLTQRVLGMRVRPDDVQKLEMRRIELQSAIGEAEAVVAGLQARIDAWRESAWRRRHDEAMAILPGLSEQGKALEEEYLAAAAAMVAAGQRLLAVQAEWSEASQRVSYYRQEHGMPGHGFRRPNKPPAIPEGYSWQATPYLPFDQWVRHWRADHR
jgi:hypothetical protein